MIHYIRYIVILPPDMKDSPSYCVEDTATVLQQHYYSRISFTYKHFRRIGVVKLEGFLWLLEMILVV